MGNVQPIEGIELGSFDLAMHLLQHTKRKLQLGFKSLSLTPSLFILMMPSSFVYRLILQISSSFEFASFAIRLSFVMREPYAL